MPAAYFYSHLAADPYFNMAFDEWLFSQALTNPATVLMRLYTWQTGAITIGFNQNERSALDFSRLGKTPVIRRVTGGRAVYHDVSELTYVLVVNPMGLNDRRLSGSLSVVSTTLAESLRLFLFRLGVTAEYIRSPLSNTPQRGSFHKAPCFASNARYELLSAGRKIVASAQKRIGQVLLQHGSIKLAGLAAHPALGYLHGATTDDLQPVQRQELSEAAEVCREAVGEYLGLCFTTPPLSAPQTGELKILWRFVRKNALQRRQIVKRIMPASSP